MNYQEISKPKCNSCNGISKAIAFFGILFAFTLGLILGAVFYETFLPILAAVIVFAITMVTAIIALLIYRVCERLRARKA